jgi:hypothetical protein
MRARHMVRGLSEAFTTGENPFRGQ